MDAVEHDRVLDKSALSPLQEAVPVDPYGDVALGVECAWPEALPVLEPQEQTDA